MPNVFGNIRQVVHGVADDLLERMRGLDGLNEPHLVLGKTCAQAYDMSAFKCAADALLLADGVQLLFHALAAGVVKTRRWPHRRRAARDEVRPPRGARPLLHRLLGRRRPRALGRRADGERATSQGHMLYPTLMFRVGNVDAERAGEAWKTIPKLMDAAEAAGEFAFPRRGAIVRPQKHAYEWRVNVTQLKNAGRLRHRRHRCALAERGRDRGPPADRRLPALPAQQGRRASKRPMRSTSRRSSASARHAA